MKYTVRWGDEHMPVAVLTVEPDKPGRPWWLAPDDDWVAGGWDVVPGIERGLDVYGNAKRPPGVPPVLADCIPDGFARQVIVREQRKRRQDNPQLQPRLDPLDHILAIDDETRLGALRFQGPDGSFLAQRAEGVHRVPPIIDITLTANAIRRIEEDSETAQDLAYLRGHGSSLGGLRPKCSMRDEQGTLWLAKFPSVSDQGPICAWELVALSLARQCGIEVPDFRAIAVDDQRIAAVIRRFDRDADGARLGYCSAAAALGEGAGPDPTYDDLVEVLRRHGADPFANHVSDLFRRLLFMAAITNTDDHLHNHGLLHVEGGSWRLAPAFDLNPDPHGPREFKTAL
ncbi:MAG: type II toxin-antitoxin system HipA family toxin, partial [Planctomycetota bacterium]